MVVNVLLLPAHKGTIFVRGNYEYVLYKITHHLLSKVEKYILNQYIIYSIFQRCTKKLNRLVLCECVYNNALAAEKNLICENIILLILKAGTAIGTISRRCVVHYTNF